MLLSLPALLCFQKIQVYHGQRQDYLELEEVSSTKFRQFYSSPDTQVLDSFHYLFHENSRVPRQYFKSVEHNHLVNTRIQFCFL